MAKMSVAGKSKVTKIPALIERARLWAGHVSIEWRVQKGCCHLTTTSSLEQPHRLSRTGREGAKFRAPKSGEVTNIPVSGFDTRRQVRKLWADKSGGPSNAARDPGAAIESTLLSADNFFGVGPVSRLADWRR